MICKLNHEIYGLVQAEKNLQYIIIIFIHNNYTKSTSEPCLFIKKIENETLLIGIYVDDIMMVGNPIHIKQ